MARKFTKAQILEAINGSKGIVSSVALKLDCSWSTADIHIKKYKDTQKALQEESEKMADIAESKLFTAINNGDTQMVKFYLTTKAKTRGYTTQQTLDIQGKLETEVSQAKMLEKLKEYVLLLKEDGEDIDVEKIANEFFKG